MAKNVTPEKFRCPTGDCPAIYRDGEDYIIVGPIANQAYHKDLDETIASGDEAVKVPAALINEALGVTDLIVAIEALMVESGALEGNPDTDSAAERFARAAINKVNGGGA